MKRFILLGLLGGLLATNTGCGLLQAVFCCHPCGPCGDCGAACGGDCCDEGCGPRCGPATRWGCPPRCARGCADCDTGCGGGCGPVCRGGCGRCGSPCDDPCADPCGNGCCGRVWHRGPLSCVFAWLMRGCGWGTSWCGGGCGERYWGDYYNDPPDCCDPCDCHGNYTGGYRRLFTGGRCRNCGGGYDGSSGGFDGYSRSPVAGRGDDGMPASRENIVSESDRVVGPGSNGAASRTGPSDRSASSNPNWWV